MVVAITASRDVAIKAAKMGQDRLCACLQLQLQLQLATCNLQEAGCKEEVAQSAFAVFIFTKLR